MFDDFTSDGAQSVPCAQTHTFAAVAVGGPVGGAAPPSSGSGFPVAPAVGGSLAVLAALALSVVLLRRRREEVAPG